MDLRIPASDLETYLGFLDESREHFDSIEEKTLGLKDHVDTDVVNGLFRALHTVKGIAGFLGLADIQKLSHSLESVFDAVRQGTLAPTESSIHTLLAGLDRLQDQLAALGRGLQERTRGAEGDWVLAVEDLDYAEAYEALGRLLEPAPPPAAQEEDLITPEMRISFLKESEELLDGTEQILLGLETAPADRDALARAFRNIHSFKGNCGFFAYARLEQASHRLETLLDKVRAKDEPVPKAVVEIALGCLDVFRAALPGGPEGELPDPEGILARLDAPAGPLPLGEILVRDHQATPEAIDYALSLQKRPLGQILVDEGLAAPTAVAQALMRQSSEAGEGAGAGKAAGESTARAPVKETKRDLRVDLAKLDALMDLVGELAISTGMVFNHPLLRGSNDPALERVSHQLKGVVSELQGVALGLRMIPVEGAFRKMTRLVHDLSSKVGKQVKLEFRGAETEVDKTVVDLIADPLVHMIRNSIDHGLEAAAERTAAGKDPAGTVSLEAGQEGGEILITVADDGRGLNRERILRKAVERGLVEGDPAALSDEDVFQFIFQPGFSTAEAVTSTSGRGVGMDVVKSNIDRLGGRIQIRSEAGRGSRITMRIPLTLSIMEGMMVEASGSLFILPLTAVRESLAPKRGQVRVLAGGQEILMLRGKALPILRLSRLLRLPGGYEELTQGLLIHVTARDRRFCIAVDTLLGQRQVVVKALPGIMGHVPGISSCSILDDGAIALILDMASVAELAAAIETQAQSTETDLAERRAA
jgi:two-component system chemotaxis sensor kinase CheA